MIRMINEDFWKDLAINRQRNLDKANEIEETPISNSGTYDKVDLKINNSDVYNDPVGEKIIKYMTFKLQKEGFKVNSNYGDTPEDIKDTILNLSKKFKNIDEVYQDQLFNGIVSSYLPINRELFFNNNKKYKDGLYKVYLNINIFIRSFIIDEDFKENNKIAEKIGSNKCLLLIQTNINSFPQESFDKYKEFYNDCVNQLYNIIKQGRNTNNWEIDEEEVFSVNDDFKYIGDKKE